MKAIFTALYKAVITQLSLTKHKCYYIIIYISYKLTAMFPNICYWTGLRSTTKKLSSQSLPMVVFNKIKENQVGNSQ